MQAVTVLVTGERAVGAAADGWLRFDSDVGTADAIYRNLDAVRARTPTSVVVCVTASPCELDYEPLLATHRARRLGVTIGCIEVPATAAQGRAVVGVDRRGRVVRVANRPQRPQPLPHDPTRALVAADVYVFDFDALVDCLSVDAVDPGSTHDLNNDVLPLLVRAGDVSAHVLGDVELVSRCVPR